MHYAKHRSTVQRIHAFVSTLTAIAIGLLISASASAGSLLYQAEFPDQRPDYVPPAVLVGFNPQPEPPARLVIAGDLGAGKPGVTISGIEDEPTELLLGVGGGHQRLATLTLVGSSCGVERNTRLFPLFREVIIPDACEGQFQIRARFTDRTVLNLQVNVRAARGDFVIPPFTLVGFNPQPEPPAVPGFGLRANLVGTGADAITIELALSDRRGNAIALR